MIIFLKSTHTDAIFIHFVFFLFLYFFQFVACVLSEALRKKNIKKYKNFLLFFSACNIKNKKCYDFIKKYYNHFLVIFFDIFFVHFARKRKRKKKVEKLKSR